MYYIADIIVLLIILIFGFVGYKRGFVKTAFGMASFFVAIILAFCLYKAVAYTLAERTGIDEWIYNAIAGKASQEDNIETNDEPESNNDNQSIEEAIKNLPENMKEQLGLDEMKDQTKAIVAEKVTEVALNIISFVGIYVVVRITLAIVCFVLDKLMLLPVLKQVNEIMGLIIGVVQGLLGTCVVLAIITFLTSVCSMDVIIACINNSVIARFLYENNFIIYLLT